MGRSERLTVPSALTPGPSSRAPCTDGRGRGEISVSQVGNRGEDRGGDLPESINHAAPSPSNANNRACSWATAPKGAANSAARWESATVVAILAEICSARSAVISGGDEAASHCNHSRALHARSEAISARLVGTAASARFALHAAHKANGGSAAKMAVSASIDPCASFAPTKPALP